MINIHPWYSLTEKQILKELGKRLQAIRLNRNYTQKEVGEMIGKKSEEISRFENGNPVTLISFLRILRALEKLENLDKALEAPTVSPMEMLKLQEKQKKRASKKRK